MLFQQLPLFGFLRQIDTPPLPTEQRPDLLQIWARLRREFFPEHPQLDTYQLHWSGRRQKRTLASCNPGRRRVIVARELAQASCCCWLEPLLYHEMCHAFLGEFPGPVPQGRRRWHGKRFKALEARHPHTAALDKWIRSGGWTSAVRSDRARSSARRRRERDNKRAAAEAAGE